MSRRNFETPDRPPETTSVRSRGTGRLIRWLAAIFTVAGLIAVLAAGAWAQTEPRPRIDPGIPPGTDGAGEGWQYVTIPGLPAKTSLGDVWVSPDGVVYVWAVYPSPGVMALTGEDPTDGEKLPGPGRAPLARSSTLYRFDGTTWTAFLQTPNETGNALLGADHGQLFASTTSGQGVARLYRFDGTHWVKEAMPGNYLGQLHALAGVPGDLYFRVDGVILHHDGVRLTELFLMPQDEAAVRGLAYIAGEGLYALCPDGHWLYETGIWQPCHDQIVFPDVDDAWGMRDAQTNLHLYAVGTNEGENGVRIWRFVETNRIAHAGEWTPVLSDPPAAGVQFTGCGFHLWGAAGNEVYAAGVVANEGRVYRFDGQAWTQLFAPQPLGAVHGLSGTPQGVVWFSTQTGQLVRYQRANQAPDISAAVPSVDRLWPPDARMVPVSVQGIVDRDGDPVTTKITRVLQDEDPMAAATTVTCPDAAMIGGQLYLRAEHADNGDGRTYVIEFTATDRLGASSSGRVTVCAPHFFDTPCDVDAATYDSFGPCAAKMTSTLSLEAEGSRDGLWVRYALTETSPVQLGVYDILGRQRRTIEEGVRAPGVHEAHWNLGALDPGIYFVKLRAKGSALTRRVVVIR